MILALVLCVSVFGSEPTTVTVRHTDFLTASGLALDSSSSDTTYFRMPNFARDTSVFFFEQNAATSTPEVSCSLDITMDDVRSRSNPSMVDRKNATAAKWIGAKGLFTDISTEGTLLFYGLAYADFLGKPGMWIRAVLYTDSDHNPTGKVRRWGLATMQKKE